MKLRLAAAIILVALSVGAAIFCMLRVNAFADELEGAIETAMAAAATQSGWEAATEEVTRAWEDGKEILHVLLPHINLNELEWTLGSLPEYLRQGDKALYIEQCIRALQCLKTVREMERPNWGNIF